ncbi:uncharacterized protein GIQ15_02109 [Arthroderma uncinatum]|uniref:uncharacterized protein n=1 Tax=Arthroderma uncinatum TaxID=74035 RepID=UPI00144A6F1B|nr:uncharacterized protein GIQ15_02109 [Arthroderma uncinatum]KAF3482785.1 hypothetical protein GIQ15_02109 [Arthroderma uncinatum]
MRFFITALVLAASCAFADPGATIGDLYDNEGCQNEALGPLIDNQCTNITDVTAINFSAANAVCYLFNSDDCSGEPIFNDTLTDGCQPVKDWADGKSFISCFGQTSA